MPDDTVQVSATDTGGGCTAHRCGDQRTVQLHPHHGRRCAPHITLPPGPFRADLAADMVDFGRADAAYAYLAGWLRREIDVRFLRARIVLALATENARPEVLP